ncbi:MAG TPA: trehalose-6-phosphate synthase [Candidatus Eremiobacteraceae bacterium]|jgi:alpha,alpha-trehalose-phosphate synthase [UDP-forming]|nr:trehalose-6-phosphate synthase [Candidatus Eremiobacteraceae bacterium]
MRTTLKIVLPLIISVVVVSLLFAVYQVRTEKRMLRNDLSRRAEILAESLQENVEPLFDRPLPDKSLQRIVDRFGQREHLKGIAVYNANGAVLALTPGLPTSFQSRPATATRAALRDAGLGEFLPIGDQPMQLYAMPLRRNGQGVGTLVLAHDAGYIDTQVSNTLRSSLLTALVQTLFISGLALILVRWTLTGPLTRTATWLRGLRTGQSGQLNPPPALPQGELFDQIHREVTHLARDLNAARATAEEEARLRESNVSLWTAERLRVSLASKLQNKPLFVVSNREPYMHERKNDGSIQVIVPASGLVTALEPVLLASNGTWVADGSGNADRDTVDARDRLRVPPDHPAYTLRRVWLSKEEEKGYYEGFSNEGMWPLCHIAHTRPIFRPEDWMSYQEVNRRFADAVLEEMEGVESPIVLAQDYHFALLPRMVKEARPDARVAIFWHIPWPNPEVFGICPWGRDLIDGLLGADLIGFHIQSHCNNFLSSVDRSVEALTAWDRFEVNRKGHLTRVRPYPISVSMPENGHAEETKGTGELVSQICNDLNLHASVLGVGVDRVDYTKGILERFRAIEKFLEMNPSYQRRFSFIQIGAPSRTAIDRYQKLLEEVDQEAARINARFQAGRWMPIVLLKKHHSHQEIARFYKAASVCMVTALHDGMNLVAKEFVASRDDDRGVLILSTFAGAAMELSDALLVNPYDVQQVAGAIHRALEMPSEEQTTRMQHMRTNVREYNIYRWAANLLSDLTEIRIDTPVERVEVP